MAVASTKTGAYPSYPVTPLTCPHCKSVPDFVKNSKRSGPQTPRAGAWFTCLECGGVSRFHTFLFRGAPQTCLAVPSLHEFLDSSCDHAHIVKTRRKILADLQTADPLPPLPVRDFESTEAVALVTAWLRNHLGNLIDRLHPVPLFCERCASDFPTISALNFHLENTDCGAILAAEAVVEQEIRLK